MDDLIAPQPDPIKNDLPASWDLVIEDFAGAYGSVPRGAEVIEDMRGRDNFGFEKYGVRIQPKNGRDNLVDAYQEILDGLVYFRSALYEEDDPHLFDMYRSTLKMALELRQAIMRRRDS
jgi:hypothetical protein